MKTTLKLHSHRRARQGARLGAGIAALLCLSLAAAPAGAGPLPSAGPATAAADYDDTCRHYANRARFMSRTGAVDFVVLLAEGCRAAQASLASRRRHERMAALSVLEGMEHLRRTVIEMNMRMVYGDIPEWRAAPRKGGGRLRTMRSVSRTGEFLIAHRMGLIGAIDRWRDVTPGFPVAIR